MGSGIGDRAAWRRVRNWDFGSAGLAMIPQRHNTRSQKPRSQIPDPRSQLPTPSWGVGAIDDDAVAANRRGLAVSIEIHRLAQRRPRQQRALDARGIALDALQR